MAGRLRPRRGDRVGAPGRRAGRGRQHRRHRARPAAAGAGCGLLRLQRHQGHHRARRPGARARRGDATRAGPAACGAGAPRPAASPARGRPGWRSARSAPWTCGWPGSRTTRWPWPELLHRHPAASAVRYPGLPDDPGHRDRGPADAPLRPAGHLRARRAPPRSAAFLGRARLLVEATSFGDLRTTADRRARLGRPRARPAWSGCPPAARTPADLVADVPAALDRVVDSVP